MLQTSLRGNPLPLEGIGGGIKRRKGLIETLYKPVTRVTSVTDAAVAVTGSVPSVTGGG